MFVIGGCGTDIGLTRNNNQDAILFRKCDGGKNSFAMGIVCDGIGGLEHGELASNAVAGEAKRWFDDISKWIEVDKADKEVIFAHLMDAAEEWNAVVRDIIKEQGINTGTTLSVIIIIKNYYYIVHVGDSRIYRFKRRLELLTDDESTARMSPNNRMKLYLNNYVGRKDELSFRTYSGEVKRGDMFIYCTDGFYHTLTEENIAYVYKHIKNGNADELSLDMIRRRMDCGETDNISVGFMYCG